MPKGRKLRGLVFVLLCCVQLPLYASTASEMYRTRAMLLLGEGELEKARDELERAMEADPVDLHALYYRGIVYSRLGEYAKASADLKAVMKADMPYQNIQFELGYADFHLERLVPAQQALEAAIAQRNDFAPAHYYLGVVRYRLKDYPGCLEPLALASRLDDDFKPSAGFMRGDALAYLDRVREAEVVLNGVIERYPESIYSQYSRQALSRLERQRLEQRPWQLELAAGASYDSNVGLFADDRALPVEIDEEGDYRAQFALDGNYRFWSNGGRVLSGNYRFFQSYHGELSDYDMQNHTLAVDYRRSLAGMAWGLNLQYVMTLLGGDDYRHRTVLSPYLIAEHGGSRSSLLKLRVSDERYQQTDQQSRDGNTYEGEYRHYWLGGDNRFLFAGLRLGRDEADDERYSNASFGIETGGQYSLKGVTVGAELLYQQREYEDDASRRDTFGKGDIKIGYPIRQRMTVEGSLGYIVNNSTDSGYDYRRSVANVMVRWRL